MQQADRIAQKKQTAAVLPETVRQFFAVVAGTAWLVLTSAFFTLPYALERHPGEQTGSDARLEQRHMS